MIYSLLLSKNLGLCNYQNLSPIQRGAWSIKYLVIKVLKTREKEPPVFRTFVIFHCHVIFSYYKGIILYFFKIGRNMDLIQRKLGTKIQPSLETAKLPDSEDRFDFSQILKRWVLIFCILLHFILVEIEDFKLKVLF